MPHVSSVMSFATNATCLMPLTPYFYIKLQVAIENKEYSCKPNFKIPIFLSVYFP